MLANKCQKQNSYFFQLKEQARIKICMHKEWHSAWVNLFDYLF